MRIVITGCRGQLGLALQHALGDHQLLCLDLPACDITSPACLWEALEGFLPEVVIHAAAMTDVDGCERNPEAAYRVNAWGTQNVAVACSRLGAAMLQVSTNDVFDGTMGRAYYEWDTPSPRSIYAQSKAAAEFYVRSLLNRFYIVRTAWLYARGGNNFVTKIIAAADRLGRLQIVTDEVSSPTYAPDLAVAISRLIETGQYGIYHFTNAGFCSRYEWAQELLKLAGRAQVPLEPITSDQWQRAAPPPLYTPMVNLAGAALGITLRPWQAALRDYFGPGEDND